MTAISKTKAIMFGGATGDTGKYSITGECYIFDNMARRWLRLEASGMAPSPRAAHAASAVESMQMVIYGGATGGGSLASDDLFLLDLRSGEEAAQWMIVPVIGTTPGRRYGHSIVFAKPHLLVFGGNTGNEPVADVWSLNVEKAPFSWMKLQCKGEGPKPRVYHASCLCTGGAANGMMVTFGGRTNDQSALDDTWGLRKHRNGSWDWVKAPYKNSADKPIPRYQHSVLFLNTAMMVLGGRTNQVGESVPIEVYDTETSDWYKFPSIERFRHVSWLMGPHIFIQGGFEHSTPNVPTDQTVKLDTTDLFKHHNHLLPKDAAFPSDKSIREENEMHRRRSLEATATSSGSNSPNVSRSSKGSTGSTVSGVKDITISNQALVAIRSEGSDSDSPHFIRNVSIDRLQANNLRMSQVGRERMMKDQKQQETLHDLFIDNLLKPKEWAQSPGDEIFPFRREHIWALCDEVQAILETQSMVLRLRAPVKIFGDIHGQYVDLMRFFGLWKSPTEDPLEGDIESFDYLFLGDYVDRGSHSLETICLLMALKIKHPDQIHLLRGNHEDRWINKAFGFAEECQARLDEDVDDPDSVFNKINNLFEWLPLAAVVEDKILCLHGGIGSTLTTIDEIEAMPRPLEVIHEVKSHDEQLVVDVLWSDPTDSDAELGIQPNVIRDPNGTGNIVKFGPDRVKDFLQSNNLDMIVRAHECVMDGFERFASGSLITVFSATDYCARHKNAGAMLLLRKTNEITPKLIYPLNNPTNNWIDDDESLKRRPATPPRWRNQGQRRVSYN
eukprot:CAMPEP_0115014480 /NCGR_PEP_ID=MMETSP0216-20121206/26107_1 /TAXON_ID=223996 /ORGANISM="Protocruzia adherens, Strain Boccale" /LENGTH=783 /DNA_ID=CAMNT_0002384235 /DNA_START=200 /DNA_END=2551 /DNA_ORIENTATION=-